ncbi:APC family permease [Streptomyces sp. NBC_01508]|uniref:APC family permease n=1 Tax=Streptomyces sp. NBC_01508 TaxID=2903888 RepID=UPI003867D686
MRASPSRRAATSPTPAPATDVGPFPSSSQLPRTVSWKAAVPIAFGGALSVTVSFGAMAGELGNVSMWVWIVTAAVGALQCLLVSDLATRFPGRAGGTAQFAFRAWPRGSATLGALSSWSYWFAWIPAVPVMLILAASYLKATFWPGINTLALAIAMALLLYALNLAGLRRSTQANIVLAIVATVPLIMVLAGPVARPSHFHASNIFPLDLPQGAPNDALGVAALMVKWAFIAACSSYGAELASTLCAEIRDSKRHLPKIMAISALTCLAAYTLIPLALLGIVGAEGLTKEPTTVFLPAAEILLGSAGKNIVAVLLTACLILIAQSAIISSSRTVYQIAQDGYLPRPFAHISRRGVPTGSLACDAVVIAVLLSIFGTSVLDEVASSVVGYLIVFILLPLAYLGLRDHKAAPPRAHHPKAMTALAVALALFNTVLLIWGGIQWGPKVMAVGLAFSLAIIPIAALTRRFAPAAPAIGKADADS